MQMLNKFIMVSQTLSSSSKAKPTWEKIFAVSFYSFNYFCLDYRQKKFNVIELHRALCLPFTRLLVLNNNFDNIIIAIYDGAVRTQLFIKCVHARDQ